MRGEGWWGKILCYRGGEVTHDVDPSRRDERSAIAIAGYTDEKTTAVTADELPVYGQQGFTEFVAFITRSLGHVLAKR